MFDRCICVFSLDECDAGACFCYETESIKQTILNVRIIDVVQARSLVVL